MLFGGRTINALKVNPLNLLAGPEPYTVDKKNRAQTQKFGWDVVNNVELRVYEYEFVKVLILTPNTLNFGVQRAQLEALISSGSLATDKYEEMLQKLDPEKCTIGGQNEDSGKFHVRIRAPRHR